MKVFYHIDDDGKCAGYWVKTLNELKNIIKQSQCDIEQ